MEAKTTAPSDDELMDCDDWPPPPVAVASDVVRLAKHQDKIDAPLYVYVKRMTRRNSPKNHLIRAIAWVVDKKGVTSLIKTWQKPNADWLMEQLRVGRWYAIQTLIFNSRGVSHFLQVDKDLTMIRELTATETKMETTDTLQPPFKYLTALAVIGESVMVGQFQSVSRCWTHYVCKRCETKKVEQEAVCPKCGQKSAGEYVWGGRCGVKLKGNVENFVFNSRRVSGVLDTHILEDPKITPEEKLQFLIGQPVGILFRQGGKKRVREAVKTIRTLCLVKTTQS